VTGVVDTVNPSAGPGAMTSTARALVLVSWVVDSPRPEPAPAAVDGRTAITHPAQVGPTPGMSGDHSCSTDPMD
jgi:hypothetical protein